MLITIVGRAGRANNSGANNARKVVITPSALNKEAETVVLKKKEKNYMQHYLRKRSHFGTGNRGVQTASGTFFYLPLERHTDTDAIYSNSSRLARPVCLFTSLISNKMPNHTGQPHRSSTGPADAHSSGRRRKSHKLPAIAGFLIPLCTYWHDLKTAWLAQREWLHVIVRLYTFSMYA